MPAALPLDPVRGWAEASSARRVLVGTLPALVAFWVALPQLGNHHTAQLNDLSAYLGGFVFYALARVLRPHQGRDLERVLRHAFACLATSCAANFFAIMLLVPQSDGDVASWWPVAIASLGLVTTVPWGLVSFTVRAFSQPAQPRTCPSPVTT